MACVCLKLFSMCVHGLNMNLHAVKLCLNAIINKLMVSNTCDDMLHALHMCLSASHMREHAFTVWLKASTRFLKAL